MIYLRISSILCCEGVDQGRKFHLFAGTPCVRASHSVVQCVGRQNLVPPLLVSLSMMENDALQCLCLIHSNSVLFESQVLSIPHHCSFRREGKGPKCMFRQESMKHQELEAARISNSRDSESMKLQGSQLVAAFQLKTQDSNGTPTRRRSSVLKFTL